MIYLVGAGPGDPGLLTLRGKALLEQAEVVIYDYLASDALLRLVPPQAERIYVGKQAGAHTLSQDGINALLVAKGREGKRVVRLKGGDPYIFGRGGEEAEALLDAGLGFEEVPGVTSAIAAPAYAGIPLTHRGYASSLTVITGHEDPTKPGSVHNWQALAASASTLVFVMGMKNLPEISRNLCTAGLSPDTPAALIQWGTTTRQRSLDATLATLPEAAKTHGFTNPAVIVVGEVVRLRQRLNWFEQRPLFGQRVVVTRAREQASDLAAGLQGLGAQVIEFPTIAIRPAEPGPLDAAIAGLATYDWVLFTSVNAVRLFWERLHACQRDTRALGTARVAAIGPATAEALAARGIQADFIPPAFVAEEVVRGLLALGVANARILLPRAQEAREVLPDELRRAGAHVDVVPVYITEPALAHQDEVLELLAQDQLDWITFGSSSTVRNFFAQVPPENLRNRRVRFASIGPITSATLREFGFEPHCQPEKYTIPGLLAALQEGDC